MPYKNKADRRVHLKERQEEIRKLSRERYARISKTAEFKEQVKKWASRATRKYNSTIKGQWQQLRCGAKRGSKDMLLSFEDFTFLRSLPCFYCGGPLPSKGAGIDRMDNREGYTLDNSTPCCKYCNGKKGRLEQMGFLYPRTMQLILELNKCRI
jgi:hypothetical protein